MRLVRRTTLTKGAIQARACAESNYAIPVRAKHPAGILSGAKLSLKASTEFGSCHHGIGLPARLPYIYIVSTGKEKLARAARLKMSFKRRDTTEAVWAGNFSVPGWRERGRNRFARIPRIDTL